MDTHSHQVELQSSPRQHEQFINNQLEPNRIQLSNLQNSLKSKEEYIYCPYCKRNGFTETKTTISTKSAALCFFTAGIPWGIFQYLRGKDLNCYDTQHRCSKCHQHIVDYKSL